MSPDNLSPRSPDHTKHFTRGRSESILLASFLNASARIWEVILGLLIVPIFLRTLGAEAYGLLGFAGSVFAFLGLFDFGLGQVVGRELAKREIDPKGLRVIAPIVRTFEVPTALLGTCAALSFLVASNWLVHVYLNLQTISPVIATFCLQLFAGTFLARWMGGAYRGVFIGLEQQTRYNVFHVTYSTIRFVGGAVLLLLDKISLIGLFAWYLACDALFVLVLRFAIWRFESVSSRGSRNWHRLRAAMPFALGMMGLGALGFCTNQMDKMLVGKLLPLSDLGVYALAWSIALGIRVLPSAMSAAVLPRFVYEAHSGGCTQKLFSSAFQLNAILASTIAAPVIFFAHSILLLMSDDLTVAERGAPVLVIVASGTWLESLSSQHYQQVLAHARTKALLIFNFVASSIAIACMWFGGKYLGLVGVAIYWPILHCALLVFYMGRVRQLGFPAAPRLIPTIKACAAIFTLAFAVRQLVGSSNPIISTSAAVCCILIVMIAITIAFQKRYGAVLLERR